MQIKSNDNLNGIIRKGIGGFYYVDAAGLIFECRAKGAFRKMGITPLVGDNCTIQIVDPEKQTATVIDIAERSSTLVRPAVANVDQAAVIFAVKAPDPNIGLLDSFLVNMEMQGIDTVICISKADYAEDETKEQETIDRIRKVYGGAGYRVVTFSNKTKDGVDEIKSVLQGKTTVLSGPSGVGKSSLINNLIPDADAEVGDISKKIGRGRNTTRHTELMDVNEETRIIDTPGYTSLEILVKDEKDLRDYYREFHEFNHKCRFTGCVHIGEPDCAVKTAVAEGVIAEDRYKSYTYIYESLKDRRKY